ncbi:MAG: hypothetical protein RML72_10515 [Bacteroidia bacterium]|nr:hypothetical protein [Bacteroidia bacterium]
MQSLSPSSVKTIIYSALLLLLLLVISLRIICFGWILLLTGLFQAFLIPIHLFVITRFIQRLPSEVLLGPYVKYLLAAHLFFLCFFLFQADIKDEKSYMPLEFLLGKNKWTAFIKEYSFSFVGLLAAAWAYFMRVMHKISAMYR